MTYGFSKTTSHSYERAIERVTEELAKEGFGVLTEIDVAATLRQKLNVAFDKYVILGACNPPFAYEALKAERDIGLLLPCNVIVYEEDGKTFIAGVKPTLTMTMVGNQKLEKVAYEVERKLSKAIDSV